MGNSPAMSTPGLPAWVRDCRTTSSSGALWWSITAARMLRSRALYSERKCLPAGITHRTELGFDAQQLVVLGDAIRARQRAGLDLRGGARDRDVGDGGVLGLPGAMRHHRGVVRPLGHVDGREHLGERADLVRLDENRVGDVPLDRFL